MAENGVRTTDFGSVVALDDVIGNYNGTTVRFSIGGLISLIGSRIGPSYATRAQLDVDLGWPDGSVGAVYGDATKTRIGVYKKVGNFDVGSWVRIGDLPVSEATVAMLKDKADASALATETNLRIAAIADSNALIGALSQGFRQPLTWDPSTGTFPANAQIGSLYRAIGAGTIDGKSFVPGHTLVALVSTPLTATYAGNWERGDFTELLAALTLQPFRSRAALKASSFIMVGQRAQISGLGEFDIVPAGTYAPDKVNDVTVINLEGVAGQAIFMGRETVASFKEDTRTLAFLQSIYSQFGTIPVTFKEGQYLLELSQISAGDVVTAGGVKLKAPDNLIGEVNARLFGVIGDGVTDDSASIALAISKCSGRILRFSPGRYYHAAESYNITTSNLTILGGKQAEIFHDTPATFEGLWRINASNVTIKLKLRNTHETSTVSQIGIDVETGSYIDIDECHFKNFRYCVLGRTTSNYVKVQNSTFDTGPFGLSGAVLNGRHNKILNNDALFFGDTAFGVTGGSFDSLILGNSITGNPFYAVLGIIVEKDAENVVVGFNTIDGKWDGTVGTGLQTGIKIGDDTTGVCPFNVVLIGNVAINCATYGMLALNSKTYTGKAISNISQAKPAVVTTTAAHGLTSGEVVTLDGIVGMSRLNKRSARIVVLSATTFQLLGTDTTTFGAYVSGGTYDNWRQPTNIATHANVITGCGSNEFRFINGTRVSAIGNIGTDGLGSGFYTQSMEFMAMLGNIAAGNAANGMNLDNASYDAIVANIAQGNGKNYEHTRPSSLGDWANNLGLSKGQNEGAVIEVRRKIVVPAGSNDYFDVAIVPDQGRFILLEAVCYVSDIGALDSGVNIITNANIGGDLNGTVVHGNNLKMDKWSPIANRDNNFGTDKYVRLGVANSTGAEKTCYVSVKYRNAGGVA